MICNKLIDGMTPSQAAKILVKSFHTNGAERSDWRGWWKPEHIPVWNWDWQMKRDRHDPRVLFPRYGTWLWIENSDIPPAHFENPQLILRHIGYQDEYALCWWDRPETADEQMESEVVQLIQKGTLTYQINLIGPTWDMFGHQYLARSEFEEIDKQLPWASIEDQERVVATAIMNILRRFRKRESELPSNMDIIKLNASLNEKSSTSCRFDK